MKEVQDRIILHLVIQCVSVMFYSNTLGGSKTAEVWEAARDGQTWYTSLIKKSNVAATVRSFG